MKQYYIHLAQQEGPFTLAELQSRRIDKNTPVCSEGMEDWQPAETISELEGLFTPAPPRYNRRMLM
jgi:hypothetical protein